MTSMVEITVLEYQVILLIQVEPGAKTVSRPPCNPLPKSRASRLLQTSPTVPGLALSPADNSSRYSPGQKLLDN